MIVLGGWLLLPTPAAAFFGSADDCPTDGHTIDALINAYICPLSRTLSQLVFYPIPPIPLIVAALFTVSIVLTVYLRFINLRGLGTAWRVLRGDHDDPKAPGEITHFQALSAALSGTVGLGNIAGVAVAIAIGGPGAAVWMIVAGILAMATKFCECTLGHKYRRIHADGSVSGGAMYYLSRGLAERGSPKLGRALAVMFAIFCIGGAIGAGNMFQANQAYEQIVSISGGVLDDAGYGWLFGLVLAVIVALVIIGGIRSIAKVTEAVVPFMGILYIAACTVILIIHADALDDALLEILGQAFRPEAGYGGAIGVMIWGVQRATFSNEAGMGSAPIAYAAVRSRNPFSVGYIALLEPLIDTVLVCGMTALVIVTSGVYMDGEGLRGVQLTSRAFASAVDWFPYVLSLAICLFAFSTMITWSYYGLKSWNYLFGEKPLTGNIFKIIFCAFIIIGAAADLHEVIAFSDSMIFLMTFPNIIGLALLAPALKHDLFHKHPLHSPSQPSPSQP